MGWLNKFKDKITNWYDDQDIYVHSIGDELYKFGKGIYDLSPFLYENVIPISSDYYALKDYSDSAYGDIQSGNYLSAGAKYLMAPAYAMAVAGSPVNPKIGKVAKVADDAVLTVAKRKYVKSGNPRMPYGYDKHPEKFIDLHINAIDLKGRLQELGYDVNKMSIRDLAKEFVRDKGKSILYKARILKKRAELIAQHKLTDAEEYFDRTFNTAKKYVDEEIANEGLETMRKELNHLLWQLIKRQNAKNYRELEMSPGRLVGKDKSQRTPRKKGYRQGSKHDQGGLLNYLNYFKCDGGIITNFKI